MRIALITPASAGSQSGNRRTATRWAAMLRGAGHRVQIATKWDGNPKTELLFALHARRSHDSLRAFAHAHPERLSILALTGTDVYRDIHTSRAAQRSLALASRIVVLQPCAALELCARDRAKTTVVVQSSSTALRHRPKANGFRVTVLGHLRQEKDPLRTLAALQQLPHDLDIEVVQIGAALDASFASRARAGARRDPRYRWVESVPHASALRRLAASHVLVVSSRMEGGANVISEALRIGVPVIASRIGGNVGLLGARYPAYFEVGNTIELARLLQRAASDRAFYRRLSKSVAALRPLVAPEREARTLRRIVRECVGPGRAPVA